jgi:drug/metabolite transporter (DMT)-like permease
MGIFLSFLAAFFASSKDIVSKRLSFSVDSTTSTFASFAYALPYYVPLLVIMTYMGFEKITISSTFLLMVILRGLTDSFAEWFKMSAFSYGELSEIAPFLALSPFFLLLFSPLITGDIPTFQGILGVLLILLGSILNILFLKGSGLSKIQNIRGIIFAVIASVFFCFNNIFDRLAVRSGTPVFSGLSMTLFTALVFLPLVIKKSTARNDLIANSRPFFARGFFEVIFMVTKLSALQYIQAPYVAALLQSSCILSIIGGRMFFQEREFLKRLCLGGVVMGGVILVVLG